MRNERRIGVLLSWFLCFGFAFIALSQVARAGDTAPPSTLRSVGLPKYFMLRDDNPLAYRAASVGTPWGMAREV